MRQDDRLDEAARALLKIALRGVEFEIHGVPLVFGHAPDGMSTQSIGSARARGFHGTVVQTA
ncbi:hypothetical protein [Variovorax sp. UC122_21]|uniref:hypothetical protein n=1 Tax=Variovorax sp. UC122_21 TaxID=3374554 RepID=UPI003757BE9B